MIRRCVRSHIGAPACARNPRLQMRKPISNDKSVHDDACLELGSMRVPRVGRYVPRRRSFLFVSLLVRSSCCRDNCTSARTGALPRRLSLLRRDAIGQCVGMKIDMITQTKPGTIRFSGLRDAVLFACREVVPRVVTSDS